MNCTVFKVIKEGGRYGEGNYCVCFVPWQDFISNSHPQMHLNAGALVKIPCTIL